MVFCDLIYSIPAPARTISGLHFPSDIFQRMPPLPHSPGVLFPSLLGYLPTPESFIFLSPSLFSGPQPSAVSLRRVCATKLLSLVSGSVFFCSHSCLAWGMDENTHGGWFHSGTHGAVPLACYFQCRGGWSAVGVLCIATVLGSVFLALLCLSLWTLAGSEVSP